MRGFSHSSSPPPESTSARALTIMSSPIEAIINVIFFFMFPVVFSFAGGSGIVVPHFGHKLHSFSSFAPQKVQEAIVIKICVGNK